MLTIVDAETGGVLDKHPTISLAAITVDDKFNEIGYFDAKIKFNEAECDIEALKINNYNRDEWARDAQAENAVCMQFAKWLEDYKCIQMISKKTGRPYAVARLAGHNAAAFDGPRLKRMFAEHKLFLPAHPIVLDTLQLAQWRLFKMGRQLESYKLTALCELCGIPTEGAHGALADCRMTAALIKVLLHGNIPAAVKS